jgi:hypothetical protein
MVTFSPVNKSNLAAPILAADPTNGAFYPVARDTATQALAVAVVSGGSTPVLPPSSFQTYQFTVAITGGAATAIVPSSAGTGRGYSVQNTGSENIWVGNSAGVTSATGRLVVSGGIVSMGGTSAMWAVSLSGAGTVDVIQEFA